LVINFGDQTITGFRIVTRIEHADAARISFHGSGPGPASGERVIISGEIDRVTGALSAVGSSHTDGDVVEGNSRPRLQGHEPTVLKRPGNIRMAALPSADRCP
jgi:hypothetical protein